MAITTASGTLGATDSTVEMGTANCATVGVEVTGTWTGTITFETRIGSTWDNAQTLTVAEADAAATITANGRRLIKTAGRAEVRARFSTATSGSPVVQFAGTGSPLSGTAGSQVVSGPDAGGAAETGYSISIGFVGTGGTHRNVTAANSVDGSGGDDIPGFGPLVWNGTTWKRLLGNTLGEPKVLSGGYTVVLTSTLTRPADTNAYAAGDEMTDTGGLIQTITGAARASGGSGVIQGVYVSQSTLWTTKPAMEIWVYDTTSTPVADNGAFAPTDAVTDTCIGVIPVTATYAGTVNQALDSGTISVPFVTVGSANLFFRIVIRNAAQDSANSGVTKFRWRISQD
jgi:hypothetical protein